MALVYSCGMSTPVIHYLSLPISERIELVEDIWDSIAEETSVSLELSSEQRDELHRRLAAHRADPTSSVSWDQVRAKLFERES
jgi:putative addiction module component (TIGR02574 family)